MAIGALLLLAGVVLPAIVIAYIMGLIDRKLAPTREQVDEAPEGTIYWSFNQLQKSTEKFVDDMTRALIGKEAD